MLCSRNDSTVNKLYFKKFLLLVSKQNGLFGPVFVKKKKKAPLSPSVHTHTWKGGWKDMDQLRSPRRDEDLFSRLLYLLTSCDEYALRV